MTITLLQVGDLILDEPHADRLFDPSRSLLLSADIVAGHVEVPHTTRGIEVSGDIPAPPADPATLHALGLAGFHVATLAGNHISDAGPNGIRDTIDALAAQGIVSTGAGMDLDEARSPALVEREGVRLAFLSYNCVGPRESWATYTRPGCAFVKVLTHYELDHANPGGTPAIYTFADPKTLLAMKEDIAKARQRADVVAVALHKGLVHTPATLAMYEQPVAYAAIDAGADIIVSHHAHILQGIEIYAGKPIYHGLGNFVTVTRALSTDDNASPARLAWAKRRSQIFGFEPDPNSPAFPFHPEARNAMIAWIEVNSGGVQRAGFYPCFIRPDGAPELLYDTVAGRSVVDYVTKITAAAGLNAKFRWEGNRIVFLGNGV